MPGPVIETGAYRTAKAAMQLAMREDKVPSRNWASVSSKVMNGHCSANSWKKT